MGMGTEFRSTKQWAWSIMALKTHYLGDAFQARLRSKADKTLESTFYDGTRRNFTYEKYLETLQQAFVDLSSTGELVSKEHKLRIFLNRITNGRLSATKNQVRASAHLWTTFEAASNYILEVLDSEISYSANNRKAKISALKTTKGDKKNPPKNSCYKNNPQKSKDNKEVTGDYYSYSEWQKLTTEQQQRVRDMRPERDKR